MSILHKDSDRLARHSARRASLNFPSRLSVDLAPVGDATWSGDLAGASVIVIIEVINNITAASVLQNEWPDDYLYYIFLHMSIGSIVAQAATVTLSSFPVAMSVVGFEGLPILNLIRQDVSRLMPTASTEAQLVTFLAISSVVNVVAATILAAISHPRLTSFLDYVPDHLVNGVFAGIGASLFLLGFDVYGLAWNSVPTWTLSQNLLKWFPAYLLGFLLYFLDSKYPSSWLLIAYVLVVAVLAQVLFAGLGISLSEAADQGHLFGEVQGMWFYEYPDFVVRHVALIDFSVIEQSALNILRAAFLGPVLNVAINSIVLNGIYNNIGNYTQEFRQAAIGLFGSSCSFGFNCYFAVADTNILRNAGGKTRRSVLIYMVQLMVICNMKPVIPLLLRFAPVALVGAIFVYIGVAIVKCCVVDDSADMTRPQKTTVWIILLVSFGCGVIAGISVGLLCCMLIYASGNTKPAGQLHNVITTPERSTTGSNAEATQMDIELPLKSTAELSSRPVATSF